MNPRSIRWRLTAWYSGVLAITFLLASAGVWFSIRASIHETVDEDLRARWNFLADDLAQRDPAHSPKTLEHELQEETDMAPAGVLYRIGDASGHWLYYSPGTFGWSRDVPNPRTLPAKGTISIMGTRHKLFRVLSAAADGRVIQIGMPLHEYYEMLDRFTWSALIASPALLLLSALGGLWMSKRALAPVDRITTTAAEIEAKNLSQRLHVAGTGDELDRLSVTLNAMLERLDNAFCRMAQFTADASHELRTPVTIIRMTAEVARAKPRTGAQYEEALDRILAESVRTTALIEDLMTLARADSNADGYTPESVDLAEIVREQCDKVQVLAQSSGVTLSSSVDAACELTGDAGMLGRMVLILLDNAIRYTPASGSVTVTLEREHAHHMARLSVRDTGIGIAADDLPHIFERFYRAAKDRSRESGGVGLGLSIAQWIARRHGGTIEAQSVVGTGTTFSVLLPLA